MTLQAQKKINTEHKFAFTLAEVLITLGIIGIIAAMTIPTLISSYQKQVAVTKLRKFYSIMSQAIKLSEIDNGQVSSWNFGATVDSAATATWFTTYLAPYMQYSSITQSGTTAIVKLADGTEIILQHSTNAYGMDVQIWLNGDKSNTPGKDEFLFEILQNPANTSFIPYDWGYTGTDRAKWTTGGMACTTAGSKWYCAGLIMYDGWQMASDYPW